MKYYKKLGLNFVTDMLWQKQTENNKVSLKQFYNDCKFNLYCKYTGPFGVCYGFGRSDEVGSNKPTKKNKLNTNLVSLGVWIIESIFEDKIDNNVLICFCFDKESETFGYICVMDGALLPEDGEYIGSLEEVRAKTKLLAKQYAIKVILVTDDVPFYNDSVLEYETGANIVVLKSEIDKFTGKLVAASDDMFWNPSRKMTAPKLKVARLKTIDINRFKKIIAGLSICFGLFGGAYIVKNTYFNNDQLNEIQEHIEAIVKPTSYPANIFIDTCLANFNKYAINQNSWELDSFKCNLSGIEVAYKKSPDAKLTDLTQMLGESITFNATGALAKIKIKFPENYLKPPQVTQEHKLETIDLLDNAAEKLNFTVNIVNNKVEINSGYSPVFLNDNQIISTLNLSEISMSVNTQSGFNNWRILGEINAK